jgi:NADH-quinone oxidoreductase subunit N
VSGGGNVVEGTIVAVSALWLSVIGYLFIQPLATISAHAASVLF